MPRHEYLYGQTLPQLEALCNRLEMPRFAAKQIARWLYDKHATTIEAMSDLSVRHRALLAETYEVGLTAPEKVSISTDGTKKYLYRTSQNHFIESAYIPDGDRATLCISSQAGCAVGCRFCSTGHQGFSRNLTTAEIVAQLWFAEHFLRRHLKTEERVISNVVMMGMGEPLQNYDRLVPALRTMLDDHGYGLSRRRVTVSTSGVVPMIERLARDCPVALAVSLHAPDDALRDPLVPLNRKYPLAELLAACKGYLERAPRDFITFEYCMLDGVNDGDEQARAGRGRKGGGDLDLRVIAAAGAHIGVQLFHRCRAGRWLRCASSRSRRSRIYELPRNDAEP